MAGLIPALASGPWLPGSTAETGPSETLVSLQQARDALDAADAALRAGETARAEADLNASQRHLDRAEQALADERPQLDPSSGNALAEALSLTRQAHTVREVELAWQTRLAEDRTAIATAGNVSAQAEALAQAEETVETGEAAVEQRRDLRLELETFARQHPALASTLDLVPQAEQARLDQVGSVNDQHREAVLEQTVDLAFTRITDEQREQMGEEARQRLAEHNPPELREHFASFDRDGDGDLDGSEAAAFFQWVEDEVQYRHDDENATAEIPGTPVGDGRPGTDYQQAPVETFEERMGDCEDTAVLQMAFHRYWGSRAYLGLMNTEPEGGIDHAAALLAVGESPTAATAVDEDLRTYELQPRDEDVRSGTYAIVDNTYSDAFGTITGDVEPGSFQVKDVETLTDRIQRSNVVD